MNFECDTQFNIPTSLLDCNGYNKKMQESTDPYNYIMDLKVPAMCFMPGIPFQGLQMAQRRPPPQLLDAEMMLKSLPLFEQDKDYVTKNIHNAKPPAMPQVLSNRLVIPECSEILTQKRTKIQFGETPQFSQRMDKLQRKNIDYMRPGIDTRAQIKELHKQWETEQNKNSGIYGIGKFDSRALKPGTNPKCSNADSSLDCMHVYGPDSTRDGKVIDPTVPYKDLVAQSRTSVTPVTAKAPQNISMDTQNVAKSINPNVSWTALLENQQAKNRCNAKFYNYDPCNTTKSA